MKTLRTSSYDIEGNSFFRVVRFNIMDRLIPVGNLRAGTGLKPALVLLFIHWFGRPTFNVLIRFEPHLHKIYLKIKRAG